MTHKFSILFALLFLYGLAAYSQNIEFIENKGQWDSRVKYMTKVDAGAFFIQSDGFTVVQHSPQDWENLTDKMHGHADKKLQDEIIVRSHAYNVKFVGGKQQPQVIADKPLYTYNNYFVGNDPSKWASNCAIYQGVTIKDIYPNIDVRYYTGNGRVKYDLIVHPGGDPSLIALKYDGADGLSVKNKELHIKTSVGELKELDPYTYQYNDEGRLKLQTKYVVKDNVVRFDVKNYDPKKPLIIDPDLVFCSFSGSQKDNWGFTATYGPDGSMYGGGITFDQGFPVSNGAYQTSYGGGNFDISIIKLSADGSSRVYATYIGGSGDEQPHSLIVDPAGNLVVAGRTNSPLTGSTSYPLQGTAGLIGRGGSYDIVVTKLNAAGSALIGSVRIGGEKDDGVNISSSRSSASLQRNYGDDGRSEVMLDGSGNIYVASCTQSTSDPDVTRRFPILNAFQPVAGGLQDGVLLKFDATLSNRLFSSYIGGSANDAAYVLSISPTSGNIYVAGGTESIDLLNGTRTGSLGANSFGLIDGFVSIISPSGASVIQTSYIGTDGNDQVYGIQFDSNGFPYIMGQTSGDWVAINAAWSQPKGRQFVAKMQPNLSAYVYSTMFGKGQVAPDISPVAFLVDRCENVYISGWGGRLLGYNFQNAGVNGLPITADAMKPVTDVNPETGTAQDFYFFVLKKDAASQLYGSFFGQSGGRFPDHVDGGTSRFDRSGVIYQAICASCGNNIPFPTTAGAWATTKPGSASCNLAMVKIAFNFDGVRAKVRSSIMGVDRDSVGCVPLTVDFIDTIQESPEYEWDFGDGSARVKTASPSERHTYDNVGTYRVMLIAIDSTKCVARDTSYVFIKVGDNEAILNFNPVKLSPPCDIFRYRFDNTSVAPAGLPFKGQIFTWDFGDNSARVTTDASPVFHTYAKAGSYTVRLFINDTTYCNSPDTLQKVLSVTANVKAIFKIPAVGCAPYEAEFINESLGGSQFTWDFGDGNTSNDANPTHTYNNPGTYRVRLTAVDSNTCNIIDTTSFLITVYPIPIAGFNASPQPPELNKPVTFTNTSSLDAIRFKWVFGDGDSLITTSRNPINYEFNLTGTYNTCLTAINAAGCAARTCREINNLVEPAVDVPNAFTPLSGDVNSTVFVRGFGIAKLRFAIYARWGEKVFETTERKIGWDGKYKGKLLPMDVYAYTLEVEFIDGKKHQKKGDITLIR